MAATLKRSKHQHNDNARHHHATRGQRGQRGASARFAFFACVLMFGALGAATCRADEAVVCRNAPGDAAAAPAGDDPITADTPGSDGTRLFPRGKSVRIDVVTRARGNDKVQWQIDDTWSRPQATGSFAVAPGKRVTTLTCTMPQAGYFAFSATLASMASDPDGTLPRRGTRPGGIASFGVLPDVSAVLPEPRLARQDLHRFGGQGTAFIAPGQHCCGGDGYRPLYTDLGLTWANDERKWYTMEPDAPNTFDPSKPQLASWFERGDIMRLILLDGIPKWAAPPDKAAKITDTNFTHSYAPASQAALREFMTRVGTESARVRAKTFPRQSRNYYQVTWEPDPDGGLPWRDSDANFVATYASVYQGIHATDPNAVVMGLTYSGVSDNTKWLKHFAKLNIQNYLDGLTIHGYYDFGTSPSHPPERVIDTPTGKGPALPMAMRDLRATMRDLLKPGAPLFVTETGISYDIGKTYGPRYPDAQTLYAQGAVVARTHLIMLGEGADVTFVFYSQDMPQTSAGYGVFFELDHADGAYGAGNISPKPAALAVAAMTRIVDGTITLGALRNTPPGVYAYAFARPDGKIVTALWSHDDARWSANVGFDAKRATNWALPVDARGSTGNVSVFDMMGNARTMSYKDGMLPLSLTESPIYVVSGNAAIAKANAITPAGYVAR